MILADTLSVVDRIPKSGNTLWEMGTLRVVPRQETRLLYLSKWVEGGIER